MARGLWASLSLRGGRRHTSLCLREADNVMENAGFCCPRTYHSPSGFLPLSPPNHWGWKPGNCILQARFLCIADPTHLGSTW